MSGKKRRISWSFIILFTFSMVNLMMMHFLQSREGLLELGLSRTSWVHCLVSSLLDVCVLYLLSLLPGWFKRSRALAICFGLTWAISVANILYGRFFQSYMPLTAITEVRNLADGALLGTVRTGFKTIDLYYPLVIVLYVFAHRKLSGNIHSVPASIGVLWAFYLVLMVPASYNQATHSTQSFRELFEGEMLPDKTIRQLYPSHCTFHTGLVRGSWTDAVLGLFPRKLSPEEKARIDAAIEPSLHGKICRTAPSQVDNVIFILVESYLSLVSDQKVGDIEATPFLNRLRHSPGTYYNGKVKCNITRGESADGQLLYMAGLLPLRGEISVSRILGKTMPGLPEVLGYTPENSRIIVPTSPTLWQQDRLSRSYGFGDSFSILDAPKEWNALWALNDERIFTVACMRDREFAGKPFFSLILTYSMHSPYDVMPPYAAHMAFTEGMDDYPLKYYNYLAHCRYTDSCIEAYFNFLKESGLYDRSLIVIVSDHYAHDMFMDMEGQLPMDIPLYIVNGGIRASSEDGPGVPAWDGPCNQVDVYSTILDIMGSDSPWRGLGCSLLMDKWQDFATPEYWDISESIIYSDYLAEWLSRPGM